MGDSTRELSFLFILLGVSAIFYATLIYLIENQVIIVLTSKSVYSIMLTRFNFMSLPKYVGDLNINYVVTKGQLEAVCW